MRKGPTANLKTTGGGNQPVFIEGNWSTKFLLRRIFRDRRNLFAGEP
jgi:hypothetical protein